MEPRKISGRVKYRGEAGGDKLSRRRQLILAEPRLIASPRRDAILYCPVPNVTLRVQMLRPREIRRPSRALPARSSFVSEMEDPSPRTEFPVAFLWTPDPFLARIATCLVSAFLGLGMWISSNNSFGSTTFATLIYSVTHYSLYSSNFSFLIAIRSYGSLYR